MKFRDLTYVCFQTTVDGTAANSHVFGIVKGLERLGWTVRMARVQYREGLEKPSILRRVLQIIRVNLKGAILLPFSRILYVRTHFASFPLACIARLMKVATVQELNGPYEDNFIAWPALKKISSMVKWTIRKQLQWASVVITVTEELRAYIENDSGQRNVSVVPNGADVDLFRPGAVGEYQLPRKYVLFFGALARWQGVDVLLEAAGDSCWPQELFLVIAGDGAEKAMVEAAARRNERVVYLGKVAHRELPSIISGSLAVIIPKNNLGDRRATGLSPIKLYEALACGVPVIVSDFPGQADLVKAGDCGLVFESGNAGDLLKAVQSLCRNESERSIMGRNARQLIVEKHSWRNRAEATHAILCQVSTLQGGLAARGMQSFKKDQYEHGQFRK